MMKLATVFLGLLAGALLLPLAAAAQEPPASPPTQQQPTELVFEREVFSYPNLQRRNPFHPLTGADEGGPRFEELRVVGILYSDDPSGSVAVLGTSTVELSEDGATVTVQPGPSWYLKVGQSVGNIRVVEIHREQVVVEVAQFGLTEQKIMQLQTRRLGGTP